MVSYGRYMNCLLLFGSISISISTTTTLHPPPDRSRSRSRSRRPTTLALAHRCSRQEPPSQTGHRHYDNPARIHRRRSHGNRCLISSPPHDLAHEPPDQMHVRRGTSRRFAAHRVRGPGLGHALRPRPGRRQHGSTIIPSIPHNYHHSPEC